MVTLRLATANILLRTIIHHSLARGVGTEGKGKVLLAFSARSLCHRSCNVRIRHTTPYKSPKGKRASVVMYSTVPGTVDVSSSLGWSGVH